MDLLRMVAVLEQCELLRRKAPNGLALLVEDGHVDFDEIDGCPEGWRLRSGALPCQQTGVHQAQRSGRRDAKRESPRHHLTLKITSRRCGVLLADPPVASKVSKCAPGLSAANGNSY